VANFDEDTITMAVAAGMDCLNGVDRKKVDGLYFATTTSPYKGRQNAGIILTALDLSHDCRTADFTNSDRAGTTALLSAGDAVKGGSAKSILLCAADYRMGKPGGMWEEIYGDGAAALLLGEDEVVARLEGFYSLSYDFMGTWRAAGDKFERAWEDRWIRDEGYKKFIPEAISGLLRRYSLNPKNFSKIIYPCLYLRDHASIGKKLGFEPDQIHDHMFTIIGNTGTASPLMMLISALEDAKPGDRILVVSYGNGCDALFFQVTEKIETLKDKKRAIRKQVEAKKNLDSYEKYAAFRNIMPIEVGIGGGDIAFSSMSVAWRERKSILALYGSKCLRCGTPQYPVQRVCVKPDCGAVDEMEDYRFSDKKGRILTYTADNLAFTPSPPAIYGIVDFEGGGEVLV